MDGSKAQQSYAMSTEQQSSNWCLQADSRQKHWLGPTSWSASRSSAKPLLPCLVFFEDLTLLSQLQTWTRVSQFFSGMQFEAKVDASIVQSISQGSRHAFHNARRGRGEGAVCPALLLLGGQQGLRLNVVAPHGSRHSLQLSCLGAARNDKINRQYIMEDLVAELVLALQGHHLLQNLQSSRTGFCGCPPQTY